jgi:hypothetical protein
LGPFVSVELAAYVEKTMTMRWQWGPPVSPIKIKNKEGKKYFYDTN